MTTQLILIGAGNIGNAILNLLSYTGDYILTVADRDPQRLKYVKQAGFPNVTTILTDISHYFDLSEDVESARFVKSIAQDSSTAFVPQCSPVGQHQSKGARMRRSLATVKT